MNLPWLTILILVPLFGGIVVAGLGAEQRRLARGLALFFGLVGLTGALCLWKYFDAASDDLQFVEKHNWVPSLGIQYFLGVDGLGLLMVMLTAIVVLLAILASGSMFDGRAGSPLPAACENDNYGAHGVTRPASEINPCPSVVKIYPADRTPLQTCFALTRVKSSTAQSG